MSKKKGFRFYKLFFLNRFWTFFYVQFQKLKKSFKNVHIFLFYFIRGNGAVWNGLFGNVRNDPRTAREYLKVHCI